MFHAIDIILQADSDAAYLVLPKERSRIAGYFRLDNNLKNTRYQHPNGAVLIEYNTLRNMVSSAAEADTCGIFYNPQIVVLIRQILISLHHPQPTTSIKTVNTTALEFTYNNIQLKISKCSDI